MFALPLLSALAASSLAAPHLKKRDSVSGFDISHYQPSVDFEAAYNDGGLRFVYIKATEGTTYEDPMFSSHYAKATSAGFIRGVYHFAHADSSATAQADFFVANGGGWSNDSVTLPGMLDLEAPCSESDDWEGWIKDFSDRYFDKTSRYPVLYSSPSWWEECTGDSSAFVDTNPLDMACWNNEACDPQGSWPFYTFWQNADTNDYGGDSDVFNGDLTQLKKLAIG